MFIKDKKGITLIELLIVIAIIGIITPLITSVFISGVNDYVEVQNYINQNYTVSDVIRHIREDIGAAKAIRFNRISASDQLEYIKFIIEKSDGTIVEKTWKFASDFLQVDIDGTGFINVVENIDAVKSKFEINLSADKQLVLFIKPKEKENINRSRNIQDEIITEFSVRYKNVVDDDITTP